MRNLKRALSLALASVMLVGMMVVGTSAASYPDVDSEDHVEAIEVLSAVGVIVGDNGNFRPDDKVSRNEMAVIMAKLILGTYEADSYVGSHPFTDVPDWASKYVAACYNSGIIAGRSETTYDGAATVTAVEAAAMMLRALGYEDLSLNAKQWDQPVAAKANEINLFESLSGSSQTPMDRNSVARLALNTLKADVVTTVRTGQDIKLPDGTTIASARNYEPVPRGSANGETDNYAGSAAGTTGVGYQQLCEKLYGKDLKLRSGQPDAFGRPASKWEYKNKEVVQVADDADLTYVKEVKVEDIYKDLGLSSAVEPKNVKFVIDGQETGINANGGGKDLTTVGINKSADKDVKVGAKGSTTTVYYAPGNIDNSGNGISVTVSVVNYYLAQATEDYDTKDEEVTLSVKAAGIGSQTVKDEDVAVSSVKKDEYYVVTLDKSDSNAIKSVASAEAVADVTVSSARNGDYVTAGQKYEYNGIAKADSGALGYSEMTDSTQYNFNDNEYTLYLDPNGYVLGVELTSGDANVGDYLVILDEAKDDLYDVVVKVMFADGSKKTITVAKIDSNENPAKTDITTAAVGKFYTFTEKKNGDYELKTVTVGTGAKEQQNFNAASNTHIENKTKPIASGPIATSKTVFIQDGKVYTGNKDIPEMKTDGKLVSYVTDKDSRLLIVWTEGKGKSTVDTDELVYILKETPARQKDADGDYYYTYDVIYQGKVTTIDVNDDATKAPGLYEIDSWTDDRADLGKGITVSEPNSYICGTVSGPASEAFGYVDGVLEIKGVGAGAYTLTDDAQVFTIDGDTVKTPGASGLGSKTFSDGFKTAILVRAEDDADAKVATVYLIKGASGGTQGVGSSTTPATPSGINAAMGGTSGDIEAKGDVAVNATVNVAAGKTLTFTGTPTLTATVNVPKDGTVVFNEAPNTSDANGKVVLNGGTVVLKKGTTLPSIEGKGTVELQSDMGADGTGLTTLITAGATQAAAAGETKKVDTSEKLFFKGEGNVPGFGAESVEAAAAKDGGTSATVCKITLTGLTKDYTLTAKVYSAKNPEGRAMRFGPDNETSMTVPATPDPDFAPLVSDATTKIVYTATKAGEDDMVWTFTFK